MQRVLSFVEGCIGEMNCPPKAMMQINVAVEEIFVNIAHYAYSGEIGEAVIEVEITDEPKAVMNLYRQRCNV